MGQIYANATAHLSVSTTVTVYTAPAGTTALVNAVGASGSAPTDIVSLWLYDASKNDSFAVAHSLTVGSGGAPLVTRTLVLGAGDQVRAQAPNVTPIDVVASILELTDT